MRLNIVSQLQSPMANATWHLSQDVPPMPSVPPWTAKKGHFGLRLAYEAEYSVSTAISNGQYYTWHLSQDVPSHPVHPLHAELKCSYLSF